MDSKCLIDIFVLANGNPMWVTASPSEIVEVSRESHSQTCGAAIKLA